MSNLNDIINQVNHLTGYRLDPITLNVSSSAPSGTINTLGIYPGSIIKSEQVLNIINALNGTTSDFIIVSGSFALPSITGSQSLVVSGGLVYGAQTVGSASYAVSASLPLEGIISASVASTTITFYKGDSTSFSINVAQSGSIESSSYAVFAQTAATASTVISASYASTASFVATASSAVTSSYAISSSLAQTASFVTLAQTASFINLAISASFALTASYLLGSISSSISSSYAAYAQTYAPVFPFTGSALISGSLQVIGQTQLSSSLGTTGSVGFSYTKSTPNIGVWSVGNPLIQPRYNLAGAGDQSVALAFGGRTSSSGSIVGTTELFTALSGSVWSTGQSMIYPRELMAGFGVSVGDNSVLAVAAGGNAGASGSNLSYTEEYNAYGTWVTSGNLNTGRQALAGVGTQTAGLAFGGYNGVNPQSATEKYSGSIWTTSNNLSTARGYLAGAGTQNAALAIAGTNGTILTSTEEYNGTAWSSGGNLNTGRYSLAAAGTQNAALAMGGTNGAALANTEEYNGTTWAVANPLSTARTGLAGAGTQTAGMAFGGVGAVGYTEFYNPQTVGIVTKTFDYSSTTGNITATGSLFGTSSHAEYAISASYALTASYWQGVSGPKSITGSLTISGSQTFENIGPAKFSGSTNMSGSLDVVGPATIANLTGSIFGTASYALTASYVSGSSNSSISSSYSVTSSLPLQGIITASIAASTITFTKGDNTTFNIVVSQSGSVESASYAVFAASAGTASVLLGSIESASYALTASYALNGGGGGGTTTGSFTGSFTGSLLGSASYATSASFAFVHISGSSLSNVETNRGFSSIQFDKDTGLNVEVVDDSVAFISIGSHYKYIYVSGSPTLVATGSDEFTSVGLNGIEISTSIIPDVSGSGETKNLIFSAATMSSSFASSINSLQSVTSSYATTGSNQFTGNQIITGSVLSTNGFTGSLQGTASQAISASYALTASYVSGSSDSSVSSSYALTSSFSFYAITSSFSLTSSLLSYQGTTAQVTSTPSSIFLIQSGSNTVFNIDSTGSLTTSGSIISNTTGSFSNLLLIKNNNVDYIKVNGEGVLQLNQYATPPTAVSGGLYFDNVGNFYIGM